MDNPIIQSLEMLYALTEGHQLSAQSILNRRVYIPSVGWTNIVIKDELKEEISNLIVDVLGGQEKTKKRLQMRFRLGRPPQNWGLDRVVLVKRDDVIRFTYIAGQDMSTELPMIRKQLLNSY